MKNVVLFSGGVDSTTALAMACKDGPEETLALSVTYGSKHESAEMRAARSIVDFFGCKHEIIKLPESIFQGNVSALMADADIEMPQAEYQEVEKEGPSSTVVPFRNALFLTIATARAIIHDANYLWIATHMSDYANWAYPDCSPEFLGGMANAIYVGTMHKVRLITPFSWMAKTGIISIAKAYNVPLELTWSCYQGGLFHCGTCPTCLERIAAFNGAGFTDAVEYLTFPLWSLTNKPWEVSDV